MDRTWMLTSLCAVLLLLIPDTVEANGPSRTETKAVGPYLVDVNLYQDPPYVDTPFIVTVVPHESNVRLQGHITVQPGLGTDATPLHFLLSATGGSNGALKASVRMPVRGAWNIIIALSGPQGTGTALIAVTVAAPGAIPTWLGWLIGASPLVFVAWWIWQQRRYRQRLLMQQVEAEMHASSG